MSNSRQQEAAGLILFVLLLLAILIVLVIYIARALFWFSLIAMVLSLLAGLYFILHRVLMGNTFENENYYFNSGMALLIVFIAYVLAGITYSVGYSDTSIQLEMKAMGYIEWYDQVTGMGGHVDRELINTLCKTNPNVSCDRLMQDYDVYEEVSGYKDLADDLSSLLRIK